MAVEVAVVAVTVVDFRGVPRFTGCGDQNVPEILNHFRVMVGLKAERVRPNDEDRLGDIVALKHVVLLRQGPCLTLIEQLVTGHIDVSSAAESSEPDKPRFLPHLAGNGPGVARLKNAGKFHL